METAAAAGASEAARGGFDQTGGAEGGVAARGGSPDEGLAAASFDKTDYAQYIGDVRRIQVL
jgi:hypothetical protein